MNKSLLFAGIVSLGALQSAQAIQMPAQMPVDPTAEKVVKAFSTACADPAVKQAYQASKEKSEELFLVLCQKAAEQMGSAEKEQVQAALNSLIEIMDVGAELIAQGPQATIDPAVQMRMMGQAQLLMQHIMPIANAAAVSVQEGPALANVSGYVKDSLAIYRKMADCFARS